MPPKRIDIMRPAIDIRQVLKGRQALMRRELDRRGISLKGVAYDSGIPYDTLISYFPAEGGEREAAVMSAASMFALCDAVPDDILSLLLPDGRLIVRVPEAVDHDEIAEACREYLAAKDHAHHPESPAQRDISPCEDAALRAKVVPLRGVAA
jgi:hypothetical protein